MKKRKSLFTSVFAKYMSLFSLLLVAGILVVGVAQLLLSTSFWVREQRKTLSEDARLLALNITEQVERIRSITPDEVRELAARYLRREELVTVVVG